jgi:hypothetical protein
MKTAGRMGTNTIQNKISPIFGLKNNRVATPIAIPTPVHLKNIQSSNESSVGS